jgi:hypothetical protein
MVRLRATSDLKRRDLARRGITLVAADEHEIKTRFGRPLVSGEAGSAS